MKKWLYLIADFSYGEEKIEAALKAGVDYIQLREKNISSAEYLLRAKRLREMTEKYHTRLIINDRLDLAALSGADGVHLGQEDVPVKDARRFLGPQGIIGATAKTPEQAKKAMEDGADYLGVGAWFFTETKKDALPISEDTYQKILQAASIPNLAVGGINAENCRKPLSLGAGGLAISAGILKAEDPGAETAKIRRILEG
ncbi:thiamine phosphate synthase [Petralouisia muris]|jgi:thiamine-phosphate diphosphorylase|uniref:Thiamine phosphate synthase n=1 Tax=Petralouisia muris TaxID=3032872 RepID=A0AC61RVV3_9FIRM|nr:thiamine phosphate synthase [Petralouisia muris]TGY95998.1 thiamine phosphate synthase [Petralouisia muris]